MCNTYPRQNAINHRATHTLHATQPTARSQIPPLKCCRRCRCRQHDRQIVMKPAFVTPNQHACVPTRRAASIRQNVARIVPLLVCRGRGSIQSAVQSTAGTRTHITAPMLTHITNDLLYSNSSVQLVWHVASNGLPEIRCTSAGCVWSIQTKHTFTIHIPTLNTQTGETH